MGSVKVCKGCKKEFQNSASDYCSVECEKGVMAQMLKEEKEKLLAEVNKKIKQKKTFMNSDKPETEFRSQYKK